MAIKVTINQKLMCSHSTSILFGKEKCSKTSKFFIIQQVYKQYSSEFSLRW